jgi:periodic tryptophan protein 2
VQAFIHRKKMTEFGNIDLIEDRDESGDKLPLPGVRKGDMASRRYQNEIRVTALKFSPNGKSWAAATTEGLLIYGTQNFVMFDPIDADITVTPKGVEDAVKRKKFNTALMMSLQLNIHDLIRKVVEATPLIAG